MIDLIKFGSGIILGLLALTLPVINIMLSRKNKNRNWGKLAVLSLSACAIAIWLPYIDIYERVNAEDWAGLIDTVPSLLKITVVLVFITVLLNTITYYMNQKRKI